MSNEFRFPASIQRLMPVPATVNNTANGRPVSVQPRPLKRSFAQFFSSHELSSTDSNSPANLGVQPAASEPKWTMQVPEDSSSLDSDISKEEEVPIQRQGDVHHDTSYQPIEEAMSDEPPVRRLPRRLVFNCPRNAQRSDTASPFGSRVSQEAKRDQSTIHGLRQPPRPCTRRGSALARKTFQVPFQRGSGSTDLRKSTQTLPTLSHQKEVQGEQSTWNHPTEEDGCDSQGDTIWGTNPENRRRSSWLCTDESAEDLDFFSASEDDNIDSFEICSSGGSDDESSQELF